MLEIEKRVKARIDSLKNVHLETPNSGKIKLSGMWGKFIDCDTAKLLFAYEYVTTEFFSLSSSTNTDSIVKLRRDYFLTTKGAYVQIERNSENGTIRDCSEKTEEGVKRTYFWMYDSECRNGNNYYCGLPFDIIVDNFHIEEEEI